jgi:pimeloyl-ACP methyl ester carboxylesterase
VSATLHLNGLAMAYEDEGDGRPVVLVHGNPTWSFYWRSLLKALPAAGMRAIAPDHIGMGNSDKPALADYDHTLSQRVADLGALIESLKLEGPIDLVAHDWGGAIAMAWAVDHVELVDRIVLMNTGAFPLPMDKGVPLALKAARVPFLGEFAVKRLNAFSLGALVMGTGQRVLPAEARKGLLAPYDSPAHRTAVHAFVKDIPITPSDPAYATLKRTQDRLPLLADKQFQFFWGMKDFVFDETVLKVWEQAYPNAEFHRYADAGHYVLEDKTAEIVPEVVRFLTADR